MVPRVPPESHSLDRITTHESRFLDTKGRQDEAQISLLADRRSIGRVLLDFVRTLDSEWVENIILGVNQSIWDPDVFLDQWQNHYAGPTGLYTESPYRSAS